MSEDVRRPPEGVEVPERSGGCRDSVNLRRVSGCRWSPRAVSVEFGGVILDQKNLKS
jgi:hypothetical protein